MLNKLSKMSINPSPSNSYFINIDRYIDAFFFPDPKGIGKLITYL
jgi:cardiolipin hydrolase